jgi:hypothetical protein
MFLSERPALTTGEPRLTIRTLVLVLVAAVPAGLLTAGNLRAQAFVPPSDTYLEGSGIAPTGAIARWPLPISGSRVLTVHFSPPPEGRPNYWSEARRALLQWERIPGFPLNFQIVPDADVADIEFGWISRFPTEQAGSTRRQLDESGYIQRVTVTLADEHSDGMQMSDEFMRLVAIHEVGHIVGLPHSENPADVMHPGNRNLELSLRDIRSARILYDLPLDEAQ